MLNVNEVSYSYDSKLTGEIKVLENISFEIDYGNVSCLLGGSGTGKTTLLKLIVGLENPTSGAILTSFTRPGKNVSYMNQAAGLLPWRTAEENIYLPGDLLNIEIDKNVVGNLIELLGLKEKLNRFPDQLSGGEQQRFSLIQRLVFSPKLLVLDEPLGALDVVLRRELSSIIKNLVTEKNLIGIVVTHQPEDALFLADEILLLAKSSILVGSSITRKFKRGLDYNDSSFYPELISELERGKQ